ncbi:MAG TPA: hypothetical protein VGO80_05265 [Solirubrobacteraceae bacterium]|nr:hypothetical protein [Solirubrobacteraceae bacterium]
MRSRRTSSPFGSGRYRSTGMAYGLLLFSSHVTALVEQLCDTSR